MIMLLFCIAACYLFAVYEYVVGAARCAFCLLVELLVTLILFAEFPYAFPLCGLIFYYAGSISSLHFSI